MRRHFEDELETLRSLLIRMCSLVDEQIDTSIKALTESNLELAAFVIEREAKVNDLDLTIERQCHEIFALAQPVAIDLRLMLAALRMNGDLERIGDIAVNIAERVEPLIGHAELLSQVGAIQMIESAKNMLTVVIDAFIRNDSQEARTVFETEDTVDGMGRQTFYAIIEEMKRNQAAIEPGAHLMALLRHVERLADHCTNIAENVIFVAEAKLMKHHSSPPTEHPGV